MVGARGNFLSPTKAATLRESRYFASDSPVRFRRRTRDGMSDSQLRRGQRYETQAVPRVDAIPNRCKALSHGVDLVSDNSNSDFTNEGDACLDLELHYAGILPRPSFDGFVHVEGPTGLFSATECYRRGRAAGEGPLICVYNMNDSGEVFGEVWFREADLRPLIVHLEWIAQSPSEFARTPW